MSNREVEETLTGVGQIALERTRKIAKGIRSEEKDDKLVDSELIAAAEAYLFAADAINDQTGDCCDDEIDFAEEVWPFNGDPQFSRTSKIDNLIRAGALIAAEIDRIRRIGKVKSAKKPEPSVSPGEPIDGPFLSMNGFKTTDGNRFEHQCGVIHDCDDAKWSFQGVPMQNFATRKELQDFLKSYADLSSYSKEVAEGMKNMARLTAILGR